MFEILDYFSTLKCEIILVSNSPIDKTEDKISLSTRFKGKYFVRENTGYDFAAWQYAIYKDLIPEDTEYLFLVNDSVIGPLHDINIILDKMMAVDVDFWGLTDNYQISWHLQSYFLCFNRRVFKSDVFRDFFKQKFVEYTKDELILKGEIQLSKSLVDAGFKGKAYFDYKTLVKKQSNFPKHNPTHFYADVLIKDYSFPFIKKELILRNPENIFFENDLLNLIEKSTTCFKLEYIKEVIINQYNSIEQESNIKINIFCHIYYHNAYHIISKLLLFKKYSYTIYLNLSSISKNDEHFIEIVKCICPDIKIINSTNVGKDIGGKLSLIDLSLKLKSTQIFNVFLHDKKSPHTNLGDVWRKKLFRIIDSDNIDSIIKIFEAKKNVGIICAKEFIANEYDKATDNFNCTSNTILKGLISKYNLHLNNYDYVGGTMFWIRADIVRDFFIKHSALSIRATLEDGNVLDHEQGTYAHAWERMLSWIAIDQGYTIKGI